MNRRVVVDPPSGWLYGFPKFCPYDTMVGPAFRDWLIKEGYPEDKVDFGMKHCRWWNTESDNLKNEEPFGFEEDDDKIVEGIRNSGKL